MTVSAPNAERSGSRRGYRIGAYFFDPSSGELRLADAGDVHDAVVRRLAPQPAELLALLAEHAGELVHRDTIRQRLWGDVEIDFEPALHFTVRQVRAGLGDAASRPRYIENLPRRGYRLVAPVAVIDADRVVPVGETAAPDPSSTSDTATELEESIPRSSTHGRARILLLAAALVAAFALVTLVRLLPQSFSTSSDVPSLAIMPFAPLDGLAERLLLRLERESPERLALIGPTTTGAYASDLRSVARMARELEIDHVLNGRWITRENRTNPDLLVELIRSSDHAHTWVESFADPTDLDVIADRIASGVRETLGLR